MQFPSVATSLSFNLLNVLGDFRREAALEIVDIECRHDHVIRARGQIGQGDLLRGAIGQLKMTGIVARRVSVIDSIATDIGWRERRAIGASNGRVPAQGQTSGRDRSGDI